MRFDMFKKPKSRFFKDSHFFIQVLDEMQLLLKSKDEKIKEQEDKIRQLEDEELKSQLSHEDYKKDYNREIERQNSNLKIYQKESELAKEQLRIKIVEIMKMESKLSEIESKIDSKSNGIL